MGTAPGHLPNEASDAELEKQYSELWGDQRKLVDRRVGILVSLEGITQEAACLEAMREYRNGDLAS